MNKIIFNKHHPVKRSTIDIIYNYLKKCIISCKVSGANICRNSNAIIETNELITTAQNEYATMSSNLLHIFILTLYVIYKIQRHSKMQYQLRTQELVLYHF